MWFVTPNYLCVSACEAESIPQSVAVWDCGLSGDEAQAALCPCCWNLWAERRPPEGPPLKSRDPEGICVSSLSVSLTRSTSWLTLRSLNQRSVGGLRGRNHTQASCWLRNQGQTASLNLCRAGFYVNNHNTTYWLEKYEIVLNLTKWFCDFFNE